MTVKFFSGFLIVIWLGSMNQVYCLGGKCNEHFTCESSMRNSEYLQYLKLNSTLPNWYELCNCDEHCHIFGDCCSGAPILSKVDLEDWSFVRVRIGSKLSYMSLMKNRCSRNVEVSDHTRQMCEQSGIGVQYDYVLPDVEQYLLFGPIDEFKNWHVTSKSTLVTYRNIYCSACNNETEVDSWSQRLKCNTDSNGISSRCTAIYYQAPSDIIRKAKLKRTPPQNSVYSTCNLGWYKMNIHQKTRSVLETVKKCLIFYEPVVVPDAKSKKPIVFKNRYCAECNNYNESQLECPSTAIDQLPSMPSTFTLVTNFDTDFQSGSLIDQNSNKTCSPGEIYNPMKKSCLSMSGLQTKSRVDGLTGEGVPVRLDVLSLLPFLILLATLN